MKAPAVPTICRIKITLEESVPPIWRRIDVLDTMTLAQLHEVLQIVMGWENYHLHEFTVHGKHYGNPEFEEDPKRKFYDEQAVKLKEVVAGKPGTRLRYHYDFGDCWYHDLLVEGVLLADPSTAYPRCEAGERRGPPEDVGGISGYQHYLEALADPEDEEHQDMLDWRGPFDPEVFSLTDVNAKLRKRFRTRPKKPKPSSLPSVPAEAAPKVPPGGLVLSLTGRECELIRDQSFAPDELIDRLQPVPQGENHLVDYLYTWDELDELAGFIAAASNHVENREVEREWEAVFERILALLHANLRP